MRTLHDFWQLSFGCNCFFYALRLTVFAWIHFKNTFPFKLSSRKPFLDIFGPSKNNAKKTKENWRKSAGNILQKCEKLKVKNSDCQVWPRKKRKDKCLSWCFGVCTTNDNVWKIPQFLFPPKTSYFYVCSLRFTVSVFLHICPHPTCSIGISRCLTKQHTATSRWVTLVCEWVFFVDGGVCCSR